AGARPHRARMTPPPSLRRTLLALAPLLAAAHARRADVRLVGEGTVSTPAYESAATVAPDGRTLYFAKRPPVGYFSVICVSRLVDGRWTEPEVAEFSGGAASDADPFLSPDGRRLYFASTRRADGAPRGDHDLWVVERTADGWGEPRPVGGTVNSPGDELHPTVDRAGTLYFASTRPGSRGVDLYRAAPTAAGHDAPVRLDSAINARPVDAHPAISPDGATLVFSSTGRADERLHDGMPYARGDLYVARREGDRWSAPRRLADGINSPAAESSPRFTPDGARLLFTSERGFAMLPFGRRVSYREHRRGVRGVENGQGNVYEVDARALAASP
ncbi:hypothetical protein, partial [Roseisolibacter sp. H3M3-2]|uniref:hypothetical protein n=1 Tax=Roseisolibacter sp. H3M3-2 TaxID=3031323 RepID=UPI0023DA5246